MRDYPKGYTGVALRVNLDNREIVRQNLDVALLAKFIGGRGLNQKFMYDEIKPGIDALGPENKIFVGVGPCNGTAVAGSQRFHISAKSPLTGFVGDSNSGGDFGAELKYAGYDMIIIEGQSETPVYLWVNDENVELRDASHLWGKTTGETRRILEREVNDADTCIISIGPGGENLVRFANLIAELGRASGRSGMGAVFGSKKLKAIAVRGTRGVKVANLKMLIELIKENSKAWSEDTKAYQRWGVQGPPGGWPAYNARGMLCTRNFQQGTFQRDRVWHLLR